MSNSKTIAKHLKNVLEEQMNITCDIQRRDGAEELSCRLTLDDKFVVLFIYVFDDSGMYFIIQTEGTIIPTERNLALINRLNEKSVFYKVYINDDNAIEFFYNVTDSFELTPDIAEKELDNFMNDVVDETREKIMIELFDMIYEEDE